VSVNESTETFNLLEKKQGKKQNYESNFAPQKKAQ